MAGTYATGAAKTDTPGIAWGGTVDVDNTRRTFSISDDVSMLVPERDLFFAYLSKYAKEPVSETVWKPMEGRHQWQRRNFVVHTAFSGAAAAGAVANAYISVNYDTYGRLVNNNNPDYHSRWTWAPLYPLVNQTLVIADDAGDLYHFKITTVTSLTGGTNGGTNDGAGGGTGGYADVALKAIESSSGKTFPAYSWDGSAGSSLNGTGQVIGSQHGELGDAPGGWRDEFVAGEFYAQRFRTAVPLFSDSARATEYRGVKDEFQRVFEQHVLAHKMDLSMAMLHGYGAFVSRDERYLWGAIPWINANGKVYSFDYATSKYDDMVSMMEDFTAPETGNSMDKLVLTSRKIISWLNRLEVGDSFFGNTGGSSAPFLDITKIPGEFGHDVTVVRSTFGRLHFVAEVNLRGPAQDYAVMVDLANVKLRPLAGNGISLDTYVRTNIQENDSTGRKDEIITEIGSQWDLGETHGLLKFS